MPFIVVLEYPCTQSIRFRVLIKFLPVHPFLLVPSVPPPPILFPLLFIPPLLLSHAPLTLLQLNATPWPIAEADCIAAQVTAAAAALSAAEGRIVRIDRPDTGRLVRANL